MALNKLPTAPVARTPRTRVKINGVAVQACIDWQVDNNSNYQADMFHLTIAEQLLPHDPDSDFTPAWFAAQTSISVEILAGLPADPNAFDDSDLTSWIYGLVDHIEYDPVGRKITLAGRDLTSVFIDTKTSEKFSGLTSSQIASTLAKRHSLSDLFVTATTTKAGVYYELEHAQMQTERSEWDLLTFLAQKEGFSLYVSGTYLHFEPKPAPEFMPDPYVLEWKPPTRDKDSPTFNGMAISFTRDLNVSRGIVVVVKSWNAKHKKGFTAVYPHGAHAGPGLNENYAKGGKVKAPAQVYTFIRPGLSQQQAQDLAQNKHRELTRHEMKLTATLPGDNILQATSVIQVTGTQTAFDQNYFAQSVTRNMSVTEGYRMTLAAKNHNTDSETLP